jgi:DNA mismatch repair protein MSH4
LHFAQLSFSGIELARLADLPADVLTEAKRVAEKLASLHARGEESSVSHNIAVRRKALLRVILIYSLLDLAIIDGPL